jgi:hypothetical protein
MSDWDEELKRRRERAASDQRMLGERDRQAKILSVEAPPLWETIYSRFDEGIGDMNKEGGPRQFSLQDNSTADMYSLRLGSDRYPAVDLIVQWRMPVLAIDHKFVRVQRAQDQHYHLISEGRTELEIESDRIYIFGHGTRGRMAGQRIRVEGRDFATHLLLGFSQQN